ncbi:TonB-dependent receptor [Aureispira sp. CCB-E]|uniref:TonB-dependent receptor n=1 Tax=Aureispira sp. CCB-E TaxID=3051121 RepID=UPI0028695E1B|nr:TonB-dependent receptor [Aureispira sp. CCB-E]WMX14883.1 TonB-dependent receptor [Aureispira sp. CCB-E]
MKCPLLLTVIFCLFCFNNWLQAQSITGTVLNQETQAPIENALVELLNHSPIISATTNAEGKFVLRDIPIGKHRLSIDAEDYLPQVYAFETGQTARIQIQLTPFNEDAETTVRERLNTKITTASQNSESLLNAPASVHIVTNQEIEERGYTSLTDILEDIPEVEIQDKATGVYYNHITVRGIQGSERFLILLDGMRINSMATTQHTVDKNFLIRYAKRVEIILGPASALYGADAFTGVINIISKDGYKTQRAEIEGSYGMYHTTENNFFTGFGNKDISFNLNGGVYYSKEPNLSKLYPQEFAWHNNQYSTNGYVLNNLSRTDTTQIDIAPFDLTRLAYFAHGKLNIKQLELGAMHNTQTHSSSLGNKPGFSPYIPEAQYSISLTNAYVKHLWKKKPNSKVSILSSLNWNYYNINNNSKFINFFTSYKKGFKYGFNHNIKLNESINISLHKRHNLIVGLSYQYTYGLPKSSDLPFQYNPFQPAADQNFYYIGTNVEDKNGTNQAVASKFYFFDQHYAGTFLQYQGNINNFLLITLGARFDYSASKLKDSDNVQQYYDINPRLGIVIKPVETLRFKLFYGEAFLAPSPEKRFEHFGSFSIENDQNGDFNAFRGNFWHLPNPDLAPEKIRSAEFSTSYTNEQLSLSLGGYYNSITNLVDLEITFGEEFLGIPIDVVERSVNKSTAYSYGGTFKALFQHYFDQRKTTKINVYASYSLSDGRVNDSLPLIFSAQHTVKAGLTFKYKRLNIHARGFFRTSSFNQLGVGNQPFFLLNAFANYRLYESKRKKFALDIFVRVRNLTNARYYNMTQVATPVFEQAPQDPIRVTAGLRVRFVK